MKKINFLLLNFILFFPCINLFSQGTYDFGFRKNDSIQIQDFNGNPYNLAWTGGLNSVIFQQIDLNMDSKLDMVVFEKHGDKLLTFVNIGGPNQINYKYVPSYEKAFPDLISWVQLIDYNKDGKNDIFTYYPGGIAVYKNVSTVSGGLSFQWITNMINSDHGGGMLTNIYCGPTDFPAISDIDNDGDLDILNFGVLGTYVDYHKNLSQELNGNSGSLIFKRVDKCWGKFAESEGSASVILNLSCNFKSLNDGNQKSNEKHVGSTLLAIDLDGDTVKDLLLGDVDFFNIRALYNGGTKDSAHIVSQDSIFPFTDTAINIFSFPVVSYLDIDNDGINELIASPYEDVYHKPAGKNQIWLFENVGTNSIPNFKLVKRNFFQEFMVDFGENSSPAVVDVDGDSLMDLIIGNYGIIDSFYYDTLWNILYSNKIASLTYLKNIGSKTQPKFKLMSEDFGGLTLEKFTALKPTFGDIDGDNDPDLIVGDLTGNLSFYQNIANSGSPISFGAVVRNFSAIDVGDNAAPQLFDINKDSLLDLLIGNKKGLISFYKNTGTKSNPVFTYVSDSFGFVQTNDYWNYYNGFSSPYFYRNEKDSLRLMAGAASGNVFFYTHIENNLNGKFKKDSTLVSYKYYDTIYSPIFYHRPDNVMEFLDEGMRTSPVLFDFNNDGFLDLLLGNFSGGLTFYSGIKPLNIGIEKPNQMELNCILYPNPSNNYTVLELPYYDKFSKVDIEILDLPGKLIQSMTCESSSNIRISIQDIPTGIYLIHIKAYGKDKKDEKVVKKLIIL